MDNFLRQQESDTQQRGGFFIFLRWLVSLLQLTEEEQEDAGVYIGHPEN